MLIKLILNHRSNIALLLTYFKTFLNNFKSQIYDLIDLLKLWNLREFIVCAYICLIYIKFEESISRKTFCCLLLKTNLSDIFKNKYFLNLKASRCLGTYLTFDFDKYNRGEKVVWFKLNKVCFLLRNFFNIFFFYFKLFNIFLSYSMLIIKQSNM